MTTPRKLLSGAPEPEELNLEQSLRPRRLEEFIGQERVVDKLKVFLQAARERREALDHVLLFGPPGLGKTTLANIIAHEMESTLRQPRGRCSSGPGTWRRS